MIEVLLDNYVTKRPIGFLQNLFSIVIMSIKRNKKMLASWLHIAELMINQLIKLIKKRVSYGKYELYGSRFYNS